MDNFRVSSQRDAIVNALLKTVEIFTSHGEDSFDEVISNGLRPVAEAAKINRISVYKYLDPRIDSIGQIYLWSDGNVIPLHDELLELPEIPPITRWLDILKKGECVHGNVRDMNKEQINFCDSLDIKTIMLVPIFTHGEFWGVISLEDTTCYKYFDDDCLELLRSMARLCANAFIRNDMMESADMAIESLVRRENNTYALNQMAIKFLSQSGEPFEDKMNEGVKLIADLMDIDRLSVWRNSVKDDGLHMSQIYRWDRNAGGTTNPTPLFNDASYAEFAPQWEKLLSCGEMLYGPVSKIPGADMFKTFGGVSLAAVPVIIDKTFWGFVLFEDCENERYFDDDIIEMMYSATFLCVNTVMRNDMEQEIAGVNEFNSATIDALPVGFLVIDSDLQFIDCNHTLLTLLGTTKEYLIKNFLEFSPEYQNDGVKTSDRLDEVHKMAMRGEELRFEWEHISSSGEMIPFEISLKRVMYKGKYILIAFQYDLRSIKKMEKAITDAEKLTHAVTEASPIPYVLFDETLHAIECNDAALKFFACPDKQYFLEHYWDKFLPEKQPNGRDSISTAKMIKNEAMDGSQTRYEWMHKSFTGELLPAENTLTYIVHQGKKFVISYKYDLRNMKKIEKRLKGALNKATIASKAKGEFLSNMSHEMRTPLNAIIGMTAIAKNAEDLDRKNYALNKIEDASAHLLGVINDVLDMSKIEANKLELSADEFNFKKVLHNTVAVITFRVEEKRQHLILNIDSAIPEYLIGDDQRLTQVITNLLGNAIKFTPEKGSVNLEARFLGEENGLCTIQISVSDTGIGINEKQQKRLFRSFHQAESSTARKYGGTGLGLAISKNIVEMMGGKIWVESEIHKGSTFSFTIKVKRSEGKAPPPREKAVSEEKAKTDAAVSFAGRRILLVEDVEINREIVIALLEPMNLEIECAENGIKAVKLVRDNPDRYDMIFMDIQMPKMDGYEATQKIRMHEKKLMDSGRQHKRIPIIAMTANVFREDGEKCLEVGMDDHLGKPLDFEKVMEKIREYLTDKRQ